MIAHRSLEHIAEHQRGSAGAGESEAERRIELLLQDAPGVQTRPYEEEQEP